MLRILEPVDLAGMGQGSNACLHHLIEAKKLAYAARAVGAPVGALPPLPRLRSPAIRTPGSRSGRLSTGAAGWLIPGARQAGASVILILVKTVLTLLLLAMFAYGIVGIHSGRVHCKGRWYEREESPLGFWATVALYLAGPPVILWLTWAAR